MATKPIAWKSAVSGNWSNGSDWSTGASPTSSNTVTIAATGSAGYTVTIDGADAASSLTISSAEASLAFGSGDSLAITNGLSVSYGTITVGAGNTLGTGGALTLATGGTLDETGGTVTIGSTGSIDGTSSLDISGGIFTLTKALSTNAGTVDITGGQANFDTTVTGTVDISGGGTAIIGGNVAGTSTFTLDGANVELGNNFTNTTFDFGAGSTDALFLDSPAKTLANPFSGFGIGDSIGFAGLTVNSATLSGTTLTVSTSNGNYKFTDFTTSGSTKFTTGTESFNGNSYGYLELVVCFASGTRIMTDRGEVAVEDLGAGDRVVTLEDGKQVLSPVTWVGHRHVDIAAHPRPELVAPVRICAGAFGGSQPHRDLLVSPDHCLLVDGKLVPAKLLVNDMTIVNERDTGTVTYHHIELERHAILLAEGLPAESYLDTGNRAFFANAGLATVLHPEFHVNAGHRCWDNACAPLASDPAEVEALWQRLATRAEALDHVRPVVQTSTDADLHLQADGRSIRPVAVTAGRHVFVLPAGARSVRLASRFAIPADLAPCDDDRRRLGVAVSRITVRSEASHVEIPADHPILSKGWHTAERDGTAIWRWTDGDALLPIAAGTGPATVEIQVRSTSTYALRGAAQPQRLAA